MDPFWVGWFLIAFRSLRYSIRESDTLTLVMEKTGYLRRLAEQFMAPPDKIVPLEKTMRHEAKLEDEMPVIKDLKDFDSSSGNWLERLVFNHRPAVLAVFLLITVLLGYQATKIRLTASFEKMIPHGHPYIKNYLQYKSELPGLGNAVRIVVENKQGDILNVDYLETLKQVSDAVFLTPGVDRAWMQSLFTPNVRWSTVTEKGFAGGPVVPADYDGSAQSLAQLQINIVNAGIIGSLVALDNKSCMVVIPLLETDPETLKPLDYTTFSANLEKIRNKAEETGKCTIHIIGFAKLVGDLMDSLVQVMAYFAIAVVIAFLIIFIYTRCIRSTLVVIVSSIIAVIWQTGLVVTLGYTLDPYSILVPFLIFAIGVSHGVQKMNGVTRDIALGCPFIVAARYTFRRLFLAGLTALISGAIGFAALMIIDIPVIKDLALLATLGVVVIIFTNLLLIPLVLSYTGVGKTAAERALQERTDENNIVSRISQALSQITERRWAVVVVGCAAVIAALGFIGSQGLQIGDLDPGAPELRPKSRYNLDNAYITNHYALSSDLFAIIVKTPPNGAMQYETVVEMDQLAWELQQLPAVQETNSLVNTVKVVTAGSAEASPKWYTVSRNEKTLNFGISYTVQLYPGMTNLNLSVMPLITYLKDHKAETLDSVVNLVETFAKEHDTDDRHFILAAGNSGIEAATDIVVKSASRTMMLYVYAAVILLCFITFRTWRAVVVAVIPLGITSLLCEALMVMLGIGVKVATLPVIALGVGIGVDYALYLVSIQLSYQRYGLSLKESYAKALKFTGKVVGLVGVTFSAGVVTWSFSPIKFQADMGLLLTFMFLWNMVGALILTPALSHFILPTRSVDLRVRAERKHHPRVREPHGSNFEKAEEVYQLKS